MKERNRLELLESRINNTPFFCPFLWPAVLRPYTLDYDCATARLTTGNGVATKVSRKLAAGGEGHRPLLYIPQIATTPNLSRLRPQSEPAYQVPMPKHPGSHRLALPGSMQKARVTSTSLRWGFTAALTI